MHPRLRKFLHDRDISIDKFHRTPEARRPKILASRGITTIFDLGASVGKYGMWLRAAGYQGRILSFEPVSAAYEKLVAASAADPLWEAHRVAVTSHNGEVTMHVADHLSFSSILEARPEYVDLETGATSRRAEIVPADTLDALVERHVPAGESLAIKMDVQGAEPAVLDGGEQAVRRASVLEVELALTPSYEGEQLAPDLLARVFGYGFRLALVENVMLHPDGSAAAINGVFVRD